MLSLSLVGACCLLAAFLFGVRRRASLIKVTIVASIFTGIYGISLNVGGVIDVLPGPTIALFFLFREMMLLPAQQRVNKFPSSNIWIIGNLTSFYVIGILSLALSLSFFGESVLRIKPSGSADGYFLATPLSYSTSNLAQSIYWLLALTVTWICMVAAFNKNPTADQIARYVSNLGLLVSLIGLYQVLAPVFSLPFPDDLLVGSLAREFQQNRYDLSDVANINSTRLSSTFGEPSHAAGFLSGVFALELYKIKNMSFTSGSFTAVKLILCLISLFATLSSTAVIGVVLVTILVLARNTKIKEMLIAAFIISILATIIITFGGEYVTTWLEYTFFKLSDFSGYESGNRSSTAERLYWDLTAFNALVDTYGLGVGFGSTRPSSFLLTVLASTGVLGFMLFCVLIRKVAVLSQCFFDQNSADHLLSRALYFCLLGWFFSACASNPDFALYFYFWPTLGVFCGSALLLQKSSASNLNAPLELVAGIKQA